MGHASQSASLREPECLVLEKKLIHEGNPALCRGVGDVMIQRGLAKTLSGIKPTASSWDKTDVVMSLNCAVAQSVIRIATGAHEIPDDYQIRKLWGSIKSTLLFD